MKISVIIPAYNADRYLSQALASVFAQSRPASEVILVDDCSTDRTSEIANGYPVKVVSTGVNSGHAAARNIGIEAATGDAIAWLDADDYWESSHLEVVGKLLQQHPSAAVAFSGVQCFGDRQWTWTGFPCTGKPAAVFEHCLQQTIVPAMSVITRTDAIRSVGGFDATIRVAPDFDLWLRMARRYQYISTDQITANRRYHDAQITATPIYQLISLNRSRFRMVRRLREMQHEPFDLPPDVVEKVARERLERDLQSLWNRRQFDEFKLLASFSRSVGLHGQTRKWSRRARVPKLMMRVWDRVTSLL